VEIGGERQRDRSAVAHQLTARFAADPMRQEGKAGPTEDAGEADIDEHLGRLLRRNAEQQRINAGVQLNQAEAEAARTEAGTRRRVASGFNQAAASGVDPGYGSPLDLLGDIAAEGALDTQIQRWKGRAGATAQLAQAGAFEQSALFADDAADQARTSGFIRAGTTLLGSAAQYGAMRMPSARPYGQQSYPG
jgi:hypothetical protein